MESVALQKVPPPVEMQTAIVNSSVKAESTYSINAFSGMHPTTTEDAQMAAQQPLGHRTLKNSSLGSIAEDSEVRES